MVTLGEYIQIEELARQGVRKMEIARRLGLHRHTVAK